MHIRFTVCKSANCCRCSRHSKRIWSMVKIGRRHQKNFHLIQVENIAENLMHVLRKKLSTFLYICPFFRLTLSTWMSLVESESRGIRRININSFQKHNLLNWLFMDFWCLWRRLVEGILGEHDVNKLLDGLVAGWHLVFLEHHENV